MSETYVRRVRKTLCVAIAILFSHFTSEVPWADAGEQPNVLFIAIDDLNDWIGCLGGHPQALTPNMDRLAQRGVLFANAHCAAPACNPSRAAVFTGRMPEVTGVWSNRSGKLQELFPEGRLLSQAFSNAGYLTLGTGKLLHSKSKVGFDQFFGVEQRWSPFSKQAVAYRDDELPSKGTSSPRHRLRDALGRGVVLPLNRMPSDRRPELIAGESFDWGPFDLPDSEFGDTQITNWAIKQLQTDHGQPIFLGVGYYRPHIPLWAPQRFFDRFALEPAELPPVKQDDLKDLSPAARKWALEPVTAGRHVTVVKYGQWRAAVEAYLACVAYIDHELGRLIHALDDSPHADNTVIVLWSDHGWHLGEKEHWGKWTGWERSTRVPLMIVPARDVSKEYAKTGNRCEQPVSLIDLYPTLIDICGIQGAFELDGESLRPLMQDPKQRTGRVVTTAFDPENLSLRTNRFRYLRYADGSEELYDHANDPHEWENLATSPKHQQQLDFFRNQLK